MTLKIDRKITGHEILTRDHDPDKTMFDLFSEMWQEIDKKLSHKDIDTLGANTVITLSIGWEGGE